jgi:hypothetical protein
MSQKKQQQIKERLEMIEKILVDAHEYVSKNINIESVPSIYLLHFGDWKGKSGHPLWMKNFMIPELMKRRNKLEKALETLSGRAKGKKLTAVKRPRRIQTKIDGP